MEILDLTHAVILDTETTGLDNNSEVVEISLINALTGDVLFTSLVQPCDPIPAQATRIHGITNDDVKDSPNFKIIWERHVEPLLRDKELVIYNEDFDIRLILQSLARFCSDTFLFETQSALYSMSHCAMVWYAGFYGQWDDYHENLRWQSLTNACRQQGIDVSDLKAHRATADCEMTRRLIHAVNAKIVEGC
ncbi:3'-5' exonuclease [Vibrio taketomensis]|uniref:3'-5' exonuclease n=1 Tax=Vibrio taketomensis TaxID=2572923 RepID=UPI00138A46E8|nr:3'-5' exonuclease [Vibrio taketomensis]